MPNSLLQLQPTWLDAQRPREGRYVLGPLLGKGGMGEVVEAWDVVLCRTVALKILRNMEPTALIRFMHEAQIQARVAHPHICRIYDVDSSEGTVKIAMQLVRGPTLEQAARELSVEAVVTLMAQVTEAVHAAHSLKLIHRDLKPSNILLERGVNGRWTPYICDFGLAMSLDEPALTVTNGVIGTPAYMAPEQFRGERASIGPETDVYALGGTLHFALLGQPPAGLKPLNPGEGARVTNPEVPADLRTILNKCLETSPGLRYPSAAALAEDLWRFLNGESVQAKAPSPAKRLWRKSRKPLRITSATALLATSLLGVWALETAILTRNQEARAEKVRLFTLAASDLEQDILLERRLPIHDLRPVQARIRGQLDVLQSRMETLGSGARGPGNWALARTHRLLGDSAKALEEARLAWGAGFHSPEAAFELASALGWSALEAPDEPATAQKVEAQFQRAKGLDTTREDYPRALAAFLRKDYALGAASARASLRLRPWDHDSACLEALSHGALAFQNLAIGDVPGAQAECLEAMASAQRYLDLNPSDESVHHAYFLAARLLAPLRREGATVPEAFLTSLQQRCDRVLQLNPDAPELQEDWLAIRALRAQELNERKQDPGKELDAALVFAGTRLKTPLTPALKRVTMFIYWQLAEQCQSRGEDPGPALAEALKSRTPSLFLRRDFLGELLNFKARSEAARGQDPIATVKETLEWLQPLLKAGPTYSLFETAAEAWLIRGAWEAAHGVDIHESLGQAQALSDLAIQANPHSASALALNGYARLLEKKLLPDKAALLRQAAQDRLRAALAIQPNNAQALRLKRALS